jgi:hypothetical protein
MHGDVFTTVGIEMVFRVPTIEIQAVALIFGVKPGVGKVAVRIIEAAAAAKGYEGH